MKSCIGELVTVWKLKRIVAAHFGAKCVALCLTFFPLNSAMAAKMLVFGDVRGHMEPCGCDPRTDVGGMRRVGAAVVRYRAMNPDMAFLFSGNLVDYSNMKSAPESILPDALVAINPDVSLLNTLEWRATRSGKALPAVKWVLSNAEGKDLPSGVSKAITIGETEYFGVLDVKSPGLSPVDQNLKKNLKKLSRVTDPTRRVLLFSGSTKVLTQLAADGFFGTIILSNQTKLGVEADDAERRNESLLIRQIGQKTAYVNPFGGGGLLRLGGLEATDFPKLLGATETKSKDPLFGLPLARFFHWLDPAEESAVPTELLRLTEKARNQDQARFQDLVAARSKDLASTPFAGSQSCESCHKSAYEAWKSSKHASAMATLIAKQRQEAPPCVECHVLGFTAKGGYVNEAKSPQFANVQCENCHGSRLEHVNNPTIKVKVSASESCAECHTPPHSPGFEYKSYWEKIKHR